MTIPRVKEERSVTISRVKKERCVTIPRVKKIVRSPLCPNVSQAQHLLPQPLLTSNFDTMVVGVKKSCKNSCPPPAIRKYVSNHKAGGDSSRSRGGSGSRWTSLAQLVVNSWIVGLATLFKPLAELKGDKIEQVSAANYKHTTLPESAKLFKYNLQEFETSPHFSFKDLDMLIEHVLTPLSHEAGGDSSHKFILKLYKQLEECKNDGLKCHKISDHVTLLGPKYIKIKDIKTRC